MTKAFILINLKTYSEGAGQRSHNIAGAAEQVAEESGVAIALAPSYMNIHPLSMHYSLPVFAQHVDGDEPGAHTGAITAEALKMAGAKGSLVNHSERRLTLAGIESSVAALKGAGLTAVVCSNNEATSAAAAALGPAYVAIEPPELETCVAILISKAQAAGTEMPEEVAFFVAKRIRSNVRELEGALRRIIANARFTGQPITLDFAKEALKDLLNLQARLVTIDNIQKTVADYFKVRLSDLLSERRSRSVARPRQVAMALAKELTVHSLPEIGEAFGGRDHTTVMHACKRVRELQESEPRVAEDYSNLLRTLTG